MQVYGHDPENGVIIIKEFKDIDTWNPGKPAFNPNDVFKVAILDIETTGLSEEVHEVIEIGIIVMEMEKDGRILNVLERYNGLQQPKKPIPYHITCITHLTDEDVEGQSIDWDYVNKLIGDVDYVIAHNAPFDRKFVDLHAPNSRETIWGCSYNQINWKKLGHASSKLECLCKDHGFFFQGHRAINDCVGTAYLLQLQPHETTYFKMIIDEMTKENVKLFVEVSFKESKYVRSLDWYWDSELRVNWKIVDIGDVTREVELVQEGIPDANISMRRLRPQDAFKKD